MGNLLTQYLFFTYCFLYGFYTVFIRFRLLKLFLYYRFYKCSTLFIRFRFFMFLYMFLLYCLLLNNNICFDHQSGCDVFLTPFFLLFNKEISVNRKCVSFSESIPHPTMV